MMSIVDTHCHLDLDAFDGDRDEVVTRAIEARIHALVLIGYNPERWQSTAKLCDAYPFIRRAVGIHPNDAELWTEQVECDLLKEVDGTAPLAIGEIGLDFYRSEDNLEEQMFAFESQLRIAASARLPVIIHQRSAQDEVLTVLERYAPVIGVMHCFTGDRYYAERCIAVGMHLGIGGVVTFPRSQDIRDALKHVPRDRLLLETDAPFLAPQAHRGKRNEPAHLTGVVETLTEVLDVPNAEIQQLTTENAIGLFGPSLAEAVRSGMEHS